MGHYYLFIMENKLFIKFLLISLLIHLLILYIFISDAIILSPLKLQPVSFNKGIQYISFNKEIDIRTSNNTQKKEEKKNLKNKYSKRLSAFARATDGIKNPAPEYPPLAIKWGYEGIVRIKFTITTNGDVKNIKILKSSGYRILDIAAVEGVKKWHFNRINKDVEVIKDIEFKLYSN